MSKPEMTVALVCGPDSDQEAQALRSALECFGVRVVTYWIGRPLDLIGVLSGEDLYPDTTAIILSFHGDEGALIMPELGEDVYEEGEPRGEFGPAEVERYAKLAGKLVIGNGCSLGEEKLARAFLRGGCDTYIGPDDYPDGNAALMFVIRFFYERVQNKKTVCQAYELARSLDEETSMYQLYAQSVM